MEILTLNLPTMYGDHHVMEVRRLLQDIPGVADVYASSCFQVVRVTYDPERTDTAAIPARLTEAGYLANVTVPLETSTAGPDRQPAYFRYTIAYPQTGRVVGFAQDVNAVDAGAAQEQNNGKKGA